MTAIVNVADDTELHGLHISPDVDTVIYTLAGAIDPARGWGLRDETWHAMAMFERYGNPSWFNLGDKDLATHIVRTGSSVTGTTPHTRSHARASCAVTADSGSPSRRRWVRTMCVARSLSPRLNHEGLP